ncbi:YitT family protein [Nakamurella sp. PAMC28650]|uniref:YczE/YyaS/YitT family protein n=1 Tax=Nakamurella sp. PAMC28650 TaxID=2762325 RepID=UPI00164E3AC3|nr:hypothetical protein [Nakamurella sp. PAMC28650]QNK81823.1 hypothetical protein H7F38_03195 [Nakamurella sp. PAMC28650]
MGESSPPGAVQPPNATPAPLRLPLRVVQLVVSCVVLGTGVALLLAPALGSDGYSTLINGLSRTSGLSFATVNVCVGVILVLLAWAKGRRPALGTIVQPVVTGYTVSFALDVIDAPGTLPARILMVLLAFVILAVGVAGYLGSNTGVGPSEALSLAWDPPVPFRWSYTVFQATGAIIGWLLGAAIGPGTLLVVLGLGPLVDLLGRRVRIFAIAPVARG